MDWPLFSNVAGVAGGCVAVLFTSKYKENMKLLRDNNTDLKERVDLLEGEKNRCKDEQEAQKLAIRVLTDTVTGAAAVGKLSLLVETYHVENCEVLQSILDRLPQ